MPGIRKFGRVADRLGVGVGHHVGMRDALVERRRAVNEVDARLAARRGLELPGYFPAITST